MIYDANLSVASIVPLFYNEGVEQIKERMGAIMNFKKKIELITMISLLAMFLLFIGGYAIGAYADQPTFHENKTDLSGNIMGQENTNRIKETMSIIHESADILYYKNGNPYIHDILTNNTDKCIIETEYCMLAYNKKGLPLRLHWNFLDSSEESSYEYLVQTKTNILPDQTEDYNGGWLLYNGELIENMPKTEKGEAGQVAYSLFCLKQVVFEDGMVWDNPNYENWFKAYVGKEIEIDKLQNYYPYKYELD